jgi:hypothetical protein
MSTPQILGATDRHKTGYTMDHIKTMGFGELARIRENSVVAHYNVPCRHSTGGLRKTTIMPVRKAGEPT